MDKFAKRAFFFLVCLTALTPFLVFKDLLFPYITSKAFFFRIIVEVALPFYIYLIARYKNFRPNLKNPLNIFVLAFIAANLISAFTGVNVIRSLWGNFERMGGVYYLIHLSLLYFYLLLLGAMDDWYAKTFLQVFIGASVILALNGISGFIGLGTLVPDPSLPARASSTFGNPIFFASFLILPMFLTVFFGLQEEITWKKIAYYLAAFIQLVGIFLSATRGAVVGLAVGIFLGAALYVILSQHKKIRLYGGIAIVCFVVLVGSMVYFDNKINPNTPLHRIFDLHDSNSIARLIQWKVGLSGFHEHPIFGTGAENYYVLGNKYYNPAIYNYDKSWFDKPHNYILEVLLTNGIVGFIAYAGVIIFALYGLYYAYREQFLTLFEVSLLAAGFLAYEVQNLFVFDTVSTSLAFFIFLGFAGYLYAISRPAKNAVPENNKKKATGLSPAFSGTLLAVSAVVMIYAIYVSNIMQMEIAKAVNYGYAYASADPDTSINYFNRATTLPFNFDPVQTASKYGDFALTFVQSAQPQDATTATETLQNAIDYTNATAQKISNDPTVWIELSNLYVAQSVVDKTPLDPRAEADAETAITLAPKRPEPRLMLARVQLAQNDIAGAQQTLQSILADIPNESDAEFEEALILNNQGQTAAAAPLAQKAMADGYQLHQPSEVSWLAEYYDKNGQYQQEMTIYQDLLPVDSQDPSLYLAMANTYNKLGQASNAIAAATKAAQLDPTQLDNVNKFIESLGGQPLPTPTPATGQ